MERRVELSSPAFFGKRENLNRLNRHFAMHDDFMLHQITAAVRCTRQDALDVMLLLYHLRLAEISLLVYHNDMPSPPILSRRLIEGPPTLPFISRLDERCITSPDELSYDLVFSLTESTDVRFTFERDGSD